MQEKFLKSIVENLINKQAAPLIDLLIGKKNVNEFFIAKKLGLTINQARNILYKLSDFGLVSFIRKKDKRKGWFIYFWTLNVYQSLKLLENNLVKELVQLESQLKSRLDGKYYLCNTCSIENSEEVALLNDFTCQECGEVYVLSDSEGIIEDLRKRISKIKKEIELVSLERKKEEEKIKKKKIKEIKRIEAEKKASRKRKTRKKVNKKPKKTKKKAKKTIKKTKRKLRKKR